MLMLFSMTPSVLHLQVNQGFLAKRKERVFFPSSGISIIVGLPFTPLQYFFVVL